MTSSNRMIFSLAELGNSFENSVTNGSAIYWI